MPRSVRLVIAAGAACALPLSLWAHGSEFLVAKVLKLPGGRVQLEVTADYGDNPMIGSETEAAAAVRNSLRPAEGAGPLPAPRLEKRSRPDPDSPLPPNPLMDGKPHQLLAAVWEFEPSTASLKFEVPPDAGQTVILWTKDTTRPDEPPRWVMLVPGDQSPPLSVPPPKRNAPLAISAAAGMILLLAGGWLCRWRARPLRAAAAGGCVI